MRIAALEQRQQNQKNREETMNDREAAWGLLTEFTQSESLRKHALAVEACMRAYARKLGARRRICGASSA